MGVSLTQETLLATFLLPLLQAHDLHRDSVKAPITGRGIDHGLIVVSLFDCPVKCLRKPCLIQSGTGGIIWAQPGIVNGDEIVLLRIEDQWCADVRPIGGVPYWAKILINFVRNDGAACWSEPFSACVHVDAIRLVSYALPCCGVAV